MATTDALPLPMKGVAYRHRWLFRDNTGAIVTGVTGADTELSKDGGARADATNEFTEISTGGVGYIDLTASEMSNDSIHIVSTCTNTNALPYDYVIYPFGSCAALGIVDSGVAQSVSATTIRLRAAAAFTDSALVGATVLLTDGTNIGVAAVITAYVGSTDTATISAWSNGATPTGTPAYVVFATAPSIAPVTANVTQINGVAVTSAAGRMEVNVSHYGGTAGTFAAGRPETNASHWGGTIVTSAYVRSDVLRYGGVAGSFTGGRPEVNTTHWNGVVTPSAYVFADVKKVNAITVNGVGSLLNPWGP